MHAPQIATLSAATTSGPSYAATSAIPAALTPATVPAAPSRLSIRLNAFTIPSTHSTVTARFARSFANSVQPRSPYQSMAPASTTETTRIRGPSSTRSSIVPTSQRKAAPTKIGVRRESPMAP